MILPPGFSSAWNQPTRFGNREWMHHDAVFEIRSKPVAGGHGHQATYRENGMLITSTIAAGTADLNAPDFWSDPRSLFRHRDKDVIPYIQALQLDGNPACPDNPLSFLPEKVPATLSFPSLRQGIELGHYLDCRPSLPTGTTTVP